MSECILECKGLKKSFPSPHGEIEVLRSVDLKLQSGESLSIRGESGSGKSTFLSVVSALENPDEGLLFWQGESVFDKSSSWQAKRRGAFMGMVFQAYYLIPELNALENVLMASRIAGKFSRKTKKRAETLLERVGLGERMKHLSGQLSGGECQRVAIARALLNEPSLLLADEPTGNLDEATGKSIMEILLKLCTEEKTSMILVTHNPDFAERTERGLFLSKGQMKG